MRLDSILETLEVTEVRGDRTVEITDVVADSRYVEPGTLFCCVPGQRTDGHAHAAAAVERGAVALLVERNLQLGVTEVEVASTREAMGFAAAVVHDHPSHHLNVVGVTGTNGKTTVTHLLGSLLEAIGTRTGVIGTLTGQHTTPEAPDLQRELARFVSQGCGAVAMEVSSHALDQHRVDATRFAVAVFTNLSRDHLDHHGSMEDYFRAKALLFRSAVAQRAVVNLDDPHGRLLFDAAEIPTTGFGIADAVDLRCDLSGSHFMWEGNEVHLSLLGRFNVLNALAALHAARALGVDPAAAAAAIGDAADVPGRMERVDDGAGPTVIVDFAHTPDGLSKVIQAVRELTSGRLLLVFGCGGDRDATKRPEMGRLAATGADVAYLTNDNPRSELPEQIRDEVLAGVPHGYHLEVELDRAAAIAAVLHDADAHDVVVIAGKGHEREQLIGTRSLPFDDRAVARGVLADLRRSAP